MQGQDGLSLRRERAAPHEIGLPSDPAVEKLPHGFGSGLTGEVDLKGGVDSHHPLLPGDHERIVRIINGPQFYVRIVMDIFIGITFPQTDTRNGLPLVHTLFRIVDNPFFYEIHKSVAQDLRMYAQVFFCAEARYNGVWHTSIPRLDRASVFDDPRDVLPDTSGYLVRDRRFIFQDRLVVMDCEIDVFDMYERVSMYSGHMSIDLCYYYGCLFVCSPGDIDTDAQ